jgi:hypothetical protein
MILHALNLKYNGSNGTVAGSKEIWTEPIHVDRTRDSQELGRITDQVLASAFKSEVR